MVCSSDLALVRQRPASFGVDPVTDPLAVLGLDIFLTSVLPRLDAHSLASSAAVCRAWRGCAASDVLWRPLLASLLPSRAHLPLPLLRASAPLSPFAAYSITVLDAAKVELSPEEMCARIWKMRVKSTCGPYWYALDPTSRGEDPLLRRFHCDHSVTSMQESDPIWGGQESIWQFVKAKKSNNKQVGQRVQINRWPHHHVLRLPDGRWHLDNYYASYTTCPDQEENKPSYMKGRVVEFCSHCNPKPDEKVQE